MPSKKTPKKPGAPAGAAALYTYRGGQKVPLTKRPDQFVVRLPEERAKSLGGSAAERVSPRSTRVTFAAAALDDAMTRAREVAPTHHAYDVADSGQEFLITDRIFVSFKDPLPPEQVDAFAARYALLQLAAYSDRDFLFQLTNHTGMNPVKLVVKLTEDEPLVAAVDHDLNHRMKKAQLALPTDPAYARQWHLHPRVQHPQVDPRSSSGCEAAWQLLNSFGSAEVVIGLTDDGCRLDHQDFNGPGKFAGWGYFQGSQLVRNTDASANPGRMYDPGADHGTACAGVIAAEADAALTVGAAPGCRLLPIKWESNGPFLEISDTKLRTALDFVADKVDVLSNSWGGVPINTFAPQVVGRIQELAVSGGRRGRGIVFLWAAGNENCPIQHTSTVQIPYDHGWAAGPTWVGVSRARIFRNNLVGVPGVMHVAALASNAQRSHYSNYGTGILVCAPTSNSHTYWRMQVPGLGVTTTEGGTTATVTDEFGGTSSATPLVAGIAGLVISANPELSALDVISILKQTASKDLNFQGYNRTPPAAFDPNPTWDVSPVAPFAQGAFQNTGDPDGTWSPWFGHGRVDARAATAEALRRLAPAQQVIRRASAPGLAIPDNTSAGVRDSLVFPEPGRAGAVRVTVDITHTYIGDLVVTLIAPSGRQVAFHNRNGGSADNLQRAFGPAEAPALAALAGEPITGTWTLWVQDLAPVDIGRLNRWELEISAGAPAAVELEDAPGLAIPDNRPAGVERVIAAAVTGQAASVAVDLDVTHTYIGDLEVTLRAPSGKQVALHSRTGGDADNLVRSYTPANLPALATLAGEAIQGDWRLRVADLAAADTGKLNRWALRIARQV